MCEIKDCMKQTDRINESLKEILKKLKKKREISKRSLKLKNKE